MKKNHVLILVILVSVGITAILWQSFNGGLRRQRSSSYDRQIRADLAHLLVALLSFRDDLGRYPLPIEGLGVLILKDRLPAEEKKLWDGPYWSFATHNEAGEYIDLYNNKLRYEIRNDHPVLTSPGFDKTFGTDDDIAAPPPRQSVDEQKK